MDDQVVAWPTSGGSAPHADDENTPTDGTRADPTSTDPACVDVVPELVPARMVNEFAYCPRLFFLEWVQSRFADNADTVHGRYVHRHVDRPAGAAPLPEDGTLRLARSVSLSSPTLGLLAVVDIIEGDTGDEGGVTVIPVERKRGRAPDNPQRSWEPERVQLCVQGLLLREAGYRCDEGMLAFAETKERVRVVFDEALVARTLGLVAELRDVAARGQAPAPLVDSPKCPRCSLVGICLPDETNALAGRAQLPLRRLLPRDPASRPVYVAEQGAVVGRDGNRLEVRRKGELIASARLIDVSHLSVFGNVQVSTPPVRELFAREVPTCWFSYGGWFSGIAHGLPGKNVDLRQRQVVAAAQGGLAIAREMIQGKIRNGRTLLRRNARDPIPDTLDRLAQGVKAAEGATSAAILLGVEGAAARTYFQAFPTMLRPEHRLPGSAFSWEGRNRRPPRDAVNCLLSYAYALLVKDLTVVCLTVGFDPYLGFYHRPRFGRPALALDLDLDLAEEFRPLIADSLVLNLINNGEMKDSDFVVRAGGVALTSAGRKAVIAGYERRLDVEVTHPTFGYRINYRRVLDVQARLLGAHVLGEIPAYTPFTTR
ncbi:MULTISPECIES: CRISPR-associated endonuclease Cas1 [unclassified Frankia]|uniref:CRISPR-associated endonuclease Cas4g/Cas1g n=1 Tax=unclassified Frankia TaxID=2632575 RepID=UPI002AD3787C|nr:MULTISPECIES: CRISPR-associated endonuclease Cas1 [unclassified Frankia]